MKNIITIIIAFHASPLTLHEATAQWGCTCLPEGITFTTQEQIDSFPLNYPACMKILGDVSIQGDDIRSLDSLYVLNSLGAELKIYDCDSLTSLEGLENLTSIGGGLKIYHDPILTKPGGAGEPDKHRGYTLYSLQRCPDLPYRVGKP